MHDASVADGLQTLITLRGSAAYGRFVDEFGAHVGITERSALAEAAINRWAFQCRLKAPARTRGRGRPKKKAD